MMETETYPSNNTARAYTAQIQEDENSDSTKFCNERFAKVTRKVHAGTTTLTNMVHYNRLIFDSGSDTSVIGRGWKIDSYYGPKINLVGFNSQWAKKKDLSICTADTILEHPHHGELLIRIHQAVHNPSA